MFTEEIEIIKIEDFYSEILDNNRDIRIYLPPSYYDNHNKFYPVLYVHDGQNVFEAGESYSGESWNLHHTAEYLIRENMIEEIIIVAVDNMGQQRLSEYAHQDGHFKGEEVKAKGLAYENFLIEELMPVIESEFRVKSGAKNTALMGSSMGGLVTFNIGMRRTDLFANLAVMSPSLWWGKSSALEKINDYDYSNLNHKIWLDTGDAEGKLMSFSENEFAELKKLKKNNNLNLIYYLVPEGVHSESAWAARVHCPLLYFFGNIGEIKDLELIGRELIGITGPEVQLNPVMSFDSGFKMTVLEGQYSSLDDRILEVNEYGTLFPQKAGTTEIEFKAYGYKSSKKIKVIKDLSSKVKIEINLSLKIDNYNPEVYIADRDPKEIKMEKLDNGYYRAKLNLKRDDFLRFKFTLGSWDSVEKDSEGRDTESHFVKADQSKSLYFEVDRFG